MQTAGSPTIVSRLLQTQHGFLTGPQSDRRELERVGGQCLTVWLKQVHSARVVAVTEPFAEDALPEADAMVTTVSNLRLAIVTADCAPVLLEDREAGVIGATHAGWRGAHAGILENTVDAMVDLGAKRADISAAIGPCIAQASYEVDDSFRARFEADDARFFSPGKPGYFQFNLERYCCMRLKRARIGQIDALGIDTYANESDYHSYRRATHRGTPSEGRQVSLIALS